MFCGCQLKVLNIMFTWYCAHKKTSILDFLRKN
jgi:hypothetical protein